MELNWNESHLIVVLRVLVPFFRKHGFYLYRLEYDGFVRDGGYLEFKSNKDRMTFIFVWFPKFDVKIRIKKMLRYEEKSLLEMKKNDSEFSNLPEDYKGEEELHDLLKGYTEFIESRIL